MEILEVEPLRVMPPKEWASNSGDASDPDSPKVSSFPGTYADQLPPGWTVLKKINKSNSRAYKVYINSDTGMKLYSLRKVLDYVQNQTAQTPRRPPNNIFAVKTTPGEHPNWLPPGWDVEIKMKMSGRSAGQRYKVYVEKSTGKKLYSLRQVSYYLKRFRSSSPEMENVETVRPENYPDWSPQDWCVQTENESSDSDNTAEREEKVTDTDREDQNVDVLPQGWFKAIRYRDSRRAGIRTKVALYVDPVSGYAFFSTKDAHRYIHSGSIKDCRIKPRFWSEVSMDTPENKFHSKPTAVERELNQEERKGKRPFFSEESYGRPSKEDIIEIEDSDEESVPKPKENTETKPLFSEENCHKKSEDVIETDDVPIGAGKTSTNENEKEKIPEKPPLRRMRIKVLASKPRPFVHCSKPTSPNPLTTNPSSVCPMQTDLRSNGENPEPKHKKQILEEGSSQQNASQVIDSEKTKASPYSLLGQSSLDSSLDFAFKTLTEDTLDVDKK